MTNSTHTPGITLIGLGTGNPAQLTRVAWDWLSSLSEVYLRVEQRLALAALPAGLTVRFLEDLLGAEAADETIAQRLLELGRRPQGVSLAVLGHPLMDEPSGAVIVQLARERGLPARVIGGLSLAEAALTTLGLSTYPQIMLVSAGQLSRGHAPSFPPSRPALITQVDTAETAAGLKTALKAVYPGTHRVSLVHAPDVEELALDEIDRSPELNPLTSLYIPALPAGASFEDFHEIIAHLRAPDGCPWDREQTHSTLRAHLLEETYEALAALDEGDTAGLCEELGDMMLQIVLNAQIAVETNEFTMADVLKGISDKIIRRHPHVFGETAVGGVVDVLKNWERLKADERKANGTAETKGLLDGVPLALPALNQAQEIQNRAARVGFDWADIEPVRAKVFEELEEVRTAGDANHRARELGDLLFAVVNLVRWYKVDAETALRETNLRFRRRFRHIERRAQQQGHSLMEMTLAEMDALWDEAKKLE